MTSISSGGEGYRAAILTVHGGEPNSHIPWLALCLARIRELTAPDEYHLFIWNDRPADTWVHEVVAGMRNVTLTTASSADRSVFPDESHLHADRLQKLYDQARSAGYQIIVTMDTDAHPLRAGWLRTLTEAVEAGAVLAGVWYEEQPDTLEPYIHPSCLMTTTRFVERNRLRFDKIGEDRHGCLRDTLCHFTTCALENQSSVHRLYRSNRNEFHHTIGGIYGDLIYHHGGGSRRNIRGRKVLGQLDLNEDRIIQQNLLLSDRAAQAMAQGYDRYIAWLSGKGCGETMAPGLIFVLGMHRSGTSCLTGALRACGCYLGEVEDSDPDNPPGGNIELPAVVRLNNQILADNRGTWDSPSATIRIQPWHAAVIADLLTSLNKQGIKAIKDPRMLLTAHAWLPLAGVCSVVGTFRHPLAVARSLARRDGMATEQALRLWCIYNSRLMRLHERFHFPLLECQFESPDRYLDELETVITCLGVSFNRAAVKAWVQPAGHSVGPSEHGVPTGCRRIYEYLQKHSVREAAAPTAITRRVSPLVFAPDGEDLYPSPLQSARRGVYESIYRLSLAYHRLPYGFRILMRKAMCRRLPVPSEDSKRGFNQK